MSGAQDGGSLAAEARIGRVLNEKWHLDRLIGVGGMAAVYEATHRNRSRVAVKMLHPELSHDGEVRQRFLREGYVANSVEHEGVARILDDDIAEDGSAFLVIELLEGETLDARWERSGKHLLPAEVLPLLCRVLEVLEAAHAKGIVHRDIKPENVFLTARGEVKLLDFGIARLRESNEAKGPALTQTGATMGTPLFMAPEQARGRWEMVDERTDVWAVGAMAFTLISGRWVHEAETWNETLICAALKPAPSLAAVLPGAPASLVAVVDRALAFEKQDRWHSARALCDAFGVVLDELAPFSRPQSAPAVFAPTLAGDPSRATAASLLNPLALAASPPRAPPARAAVTTPPVTAPGANTDGSSLPSDDASLRRRRPSFAWVIVPLAACGAAFYFYDNGYFNRPPSGGVADRASADASARRVDIGAPAASGDDDGPAASAPAPATASASPLASVKPAASARPGAGDDDDDGPSAPMAQLPRNGPPPYTPPPYAPYPKPTAHPANGKAPGAQPHHTTHKKHKPH